MLGAGGLSKRERSTWGKALGSRTSPKTWTRAVDSSFDPPSLNETPCPIHWVEPRDYQRGRGVWEGPSDPPPSLPGDPDTGFLPGRVWVTSVVMIVMGWLTCGTPHIATPRNLGEAMVQGRATV